MNKPKAAPQDLTLLDEFEKNVETVIGVLENSVSIIDQWIKDLPNSARTGGKFVPRRTIDDLLLMLHSFYPLGDSLPEIKRFLTYHAPRYESRVKKSYSDINKKIDEIVGKCGQGPHPLNPLPNPAIPFYEMGELRRDIEKLVGDLRFCVKIAREKLAAGTQPASSKAGDMNKPAKAKPDSVPAGNIKIQNFQGILGDVQAENVQTGDYAGINKHDGTEKEKKGIIKKLFGIIVAVVAFLAALLGIFNHLGWLEPIKEFISRIFLHI